MPAQERLPRHLFIARIWFERPDTWRGEVEHIRSGQKQYFTSLYDLDDFIGLKVGRPAHFEIPALNPLSGGLD